MKQKVLLIGVMVLVAALASVVAVTAQGPKPRGPSAMLFMPFTYQGDLKKNGNPINDICIMSYSLWDASGGGSQVGSPQTINPVTVTAGLFTVQLNDGNQFGPNAFDGSNRWLQNAVQCTGDGIPVTLTRQMVTAAPYAQYALNAASALTATNFSGSLQGDVTGAQGANTISRLQGFPLSLTLPITGQVLTWDGQRWLALTDVGGTADWRLAGNGGTSASNFVGTSDNMTLTLAVSGTAALRLVPNPDSPIFIGGYAGNAVAGLVDGATIGGGGSPVYGSNVISGTNATYSTIAGGIANLINGFAFNSSIGGGYHNVISGSNAYRSFIGGGSDNTSNSYYTVIGGGSGNNSNSYYTVIGGGRDNLAGNNYATVSGGAGNHVTNTYGTIGGGVSNVVGGYIATIGGGNQNNAAGPYAAIGGGYQNNAGGYIATIGGGESNLAGNNYATVSGGLLNHVTNTLGTIGGGISNFVSGSAATIGGGEGNQASDRSASIGGGYQNNASSYAATIGGGYQNNASGYVATIGGGYQNNAKGYIATIGGGANNIASISYTTVGGGQSNSASAFAAVVPGGYNNVAEGNTSFASGNGARALNDGTFVWADSMTGTTASGANNQFIARASGGVWFGAGSGYYTVTDLLAAGQFISTSTGAYLSTSGVWTNNSNRASKENFTPVDGRSVLARVAVLPLSEWNYKVDSANVRHLGPMAQDFRAAFGLGTNETSISTIDEEGVALAAIQGLNQQVQDKDALLAKQQQQLDALQQQNAALDARLTALEQSGRPGSVIAATQPADGMVLWVLSSLFGALLALVVMRISCRHTRP